MSWDEDSLDETRWLSFRARLKEPREDIHLSHRSLNGDSQDFRSHSTKEVLLGVSRVLWGLSNPMTGISPSTSRESFG